MGLMQEFQANPELMQRFVLQHITKEKIPMSVNSNQELVVKTLAETTLEIITLRRWMVSF